MGTSGEHLIQDLLSENMQKQKSIYLIFNYILLVNKICSFYQIYCSTSPIWTINICSFTIFSVPSVYFIVFFFASERLRINSDIGN